MINQLAKELLSQLNHIVEQCETEDFSKPLQILGDSTLGQHIRHTLEFFICLFDAKNTGIIDYDDRKHDELIQTDKKLTQSIIQSITQFLDENEKDFPVLFKINYSTDDNNSEMMSSSFFREISYNMEHAIHHMALIKVAVNHKLTYISLPKNFGIASSTVRYHASKQN